MKLLKKTAIAAAVLWLSACWSLPVELGTARVIDLTHVLHEDSPVWPGATPLKRQTLVDYDSGYFLQSFYLGDNIGTHVDAPAHFVEGALKIHELGAETLVAPTVVINAQDKAAANADYQLTRQDVLDWEAEHGRIRAGDFVIMNTGWYKKWSIPGAYNNIDAAGVQHFPGFGPDSAELLLERKVAGIGIDTLSLDHGASTDFATHLLILGANKYQVENLNNLDAVPVTGAYISIGVIPVKDAGQAQARVFAYLPD